MKKVCAISTVEVTLDSFVIPAMKELKKQGADVTLVCSMNEKFMERNKEFKCVNINMKRGIDIVGSIKAITAFYKLFKREKFDAIQYATPNASLYASIAGQLAKIPVRIYCQWGIRYVGLSGFSRKIFKFIEKTTIKNSTAVRSASPKNREFAIGEGLVASSKIKVYGLGGTVGVDLDEYKIENKAAFAAQIKEKYNIPQEAFLFGFVGRMNRDKGVNELLCAFKELEAANTYLMLVGGIDSANPIDADLLQYAKENDRVILTGEVPSDEVVNYLSAFDILVQPTYREGFGKVLQEAMAMMVPVITTDVLGASEVIEDNISGVLVPAKNVDTLSQEMNALMLDKKRLEEFAAEGRKRVEKYFARPIMLKYILDDYKELLDIKETF